VTAPLRILVVDDDPLLLSALARLFRKHTVTAVADVAAALSAIDAGTTFDTIVSDLMLPGRSGADFYREVHRRSSDLAQRFVFLTGGATTPATERFLSEVRQPVFAKPFDRDELRKAVEAIATSARAE
jgi:CheY-like chemotaxis protein